MCEERRLRTWRVERVASKPAQVNQPNPATQPMHQTVPVAVNEAQVIRLKRGALQAAERGDFRTMRCALDALEVEVKKANREREWLDAWGTCYRILCNRVPGAISPEPAGVAVPDIDGWLDRALEKVETKTSQWLE